MRTPSVPVRTPPFRVIREARGWSLRRLASAAAVDPTYLSRVERGQQQPSIETLYRLGQALGLREMVQLLEPYLIDGTPELPDSAPVSPPRGSVRRSA